MCLIFWLISHFQNSLGFTQIERKIELVLTIEKDDQLAIPFNFIFNEQIPHEFELLLSYDFYIKQRKKVKIKFKHKKKQQLKLKTNSIEK